MKKCMWGATVWLVLMSVLVASTLAQAPALETALGTAFTYQGRLQANGEPVTDDCGMAFRLYDASSGGNQVGNAITTTVPVSTGLFTASLDFGDAFNGDNRWLGIRVKCGDDATYADLGRQALTAAPYALYARSTGALQGQPVADALPALDQVLKWDGSAWAPADESGAGGGHWSLTGNSATVPGTHFLGTTDGVSLTLAVSGTAALRLEPNATSPNLVGGHSSNQAAGVVGATVGGGGTGDAPNRVTAGFGTVGGGSGNQASGNRATVSGGWDNTADGIVATVSGGRDNLADGMFTTVSGGWNNTAGQSRATVSGGASNTASGEGATVGGGAANVVTATFATVAGGEHISVTGGYAAVGGGQYNVASGDFAFVGGGDSNTASYGFATVGGGEDNTASGNWTTVGGGDSNTASGNWTTIGGGDDNTASGYAATIGGGDSNTASYGYATVGGGYYNDATAIGATVGGGAINDATATYATVGGGEDNTATATCATVGGGYDNDATGYYTTVSGGFSNDATGYYAAVPGGYDSDASGDYSFAAGRRAKANNQGCFVWGDSTNAEVACRFNNGWVARASGGVYFFTNSSLTSGMYLSAGGSSWNAVSDRARKENFVPIDAQELLARLAEIPITTWNYKSQDPAIRHIGPMAQDFNRLIDGLGGEGEDYINTLDAHGVALAAIQELYAQNQSQGAQIEALQRQNADLEARLAALEAASANSVSAIQSGVLNFGNGGWMPGFGVLLLGLGAVWGMRRAPRNIRAGGTEEGER